MTDKKQKPTKEEKAEIREENKVWNQMIRKMESKGALVNDSGVHTDEDWEQKTISERDLSEG